MTFKRTNDLDRLRNCTVVEGNLVLSLDIMEPEVVGPNGQVGQGPTPPDLNFTFPEVKLCSFD